MNMRHNRRPPLRTSRMVPSRVSLRRGEPVQVACAVCGRWRLLERGMLRPHRADDGRTRCPGSGQRITVDEQPEQWLARLRLAERNPSMR
ncbi:hypothetical protein JQS43_24445 [Natronosporangium hydrolyticum]|uniref:Uncharacterized protein n=1 Tax=Natronosporangium hydrolyticum TaxID=2811111 RepID=A0A895YEL4_9ACTN|nr:hypothetical protein [Natronosporangium hydrolyticum]QSB14585.1 hypothetical protein JQS43_24445 [Natronosporangium hydrolyticum]